MLHCSEYSLTDVYIRALSQLVREAFSHTGIMDGVYVYTNIIHCQVLIQLNELEQDVNELLQMTSEDTNPQCFEPGFYELTTN